MKVGVFLLAVPALAAPVNTEGPVAIIRHESPIMLLRRPMLHIASPGALLLSQPFMPVNPLEELRRSMLLGMGAPDFFEDEEENEDPFDAMLGEAHGLFGLFGDPLLHRGVGRGFDLSRLPNGTLQIAARMHGLEPTSLRVRVDAGARMCVITGTQITEGGVGSFQRTFSLPTNAVRRPASPGPRRSLLSLAPTAASLPSPCCR